MIDLIFIYFVSAASVVVLYISMVLTVRFPVSAFVRAHLLVVDCFTSLRLKIISNMFDIVASPRLGKD